MGRLDGKVVFITGGARGLGRSYALEVAAEGADVAIADICKSIPGRAIKLADRADLDATVADVEAAGRRAVGFVADVRDSAALGAAVQATIDELGRIDVMFAQNDYAI